MASSNASSTGHLESLFGSLQWRCFWIPWPFLFGELTSPAIGLSLSCFCPSSSSAMSLLLRLRVGMGSHHPLTCHELLRILWVTVCWVWNWGMLVVECVRLFFVSSCCGLSCVILVVFYSYMGSAWVSRDIYYRFLTGLRPLA